MKWLQAKTLDDLKACGSFNELRQQIKESLGEKLSLKFGSWEDMFCAVQELRDFVTKACGTISENNDESKETDTNSLYFQSDAARIIYALLELDGEQRLKELGIDKSYTKDLEKAKSWRNNIAKVIHPDVCKHPNASEASIKLTKLYERMTGQ